MRKRSKLKMEQSKNSKMELDELAASTRRNKNESAIRETLRSPDE